VLCEHVHVLVFILARVHPRGVSDVRAATVAAAHGVFCRAEKEHVLAKVREPRKLVRVLVITNAHRERRASLVRVRVARQQRNEAIWQRHALVAFFCARVIFLDVSHGE